MEEEKCDDCEYYRRPDLGCEQCKFKKFKGIFLKEEEKETW